MISFRFVSSIPLSIVCVCALVSSATAQERVRHATGSVPYRWNLNPPRPAAHTTAETLPRGPQSDSYVNDETELLSHVWDDGAADEPLAILDTCSSNVCGSQDRFWLSAEYLYWFTLGQQVPPLVTTSSAGTPQASAGVLGEPTTSVLLGNDRLVTDGQSGGRLSFGFWLDECRDVGVDFVYMAIGDQDDRFNASSVAFPILARPFFNVSTVAQDSRLLGFPNVAAGNISVNATSQYQVFEALIRRPISHDPATETYLVYGYRYAELEDSLLIHDSSTSLSGATAGSTLAISDDFQTRNTFNGFEAGLLTHFRFCSCWQLSLSGKVAWGETRSLTTISGESVSTNTVGDTSTTNSGLLTQASNIGRFKSNSHGALQDFSINLRRYLWSGVSASLGYGVHRWVGVRRAGDQIDTSVNPTQIPPGTLIGAARPQPRDQISDFVAQGLTMGLEYHW